MLVRRVMGAHVRSASLRVSSSRRLVLNQKGLVQCSLKSSMQLAELGTGSLIMCRALRIGKRPLLYVALSPLGKSGRAEAAADESVTRAALMLLG